MDNFIVTLNISDKIKSLKSVSDASLRNAAALELAQTKEPEVLNALIELIKRPDLKDLRGTLVHSLGFYDCKPHFNLLIELVVIGNWEVAHEAFGLVTAVDKITGEQAESAYQTLKKFSENNTEKWRKDIIVELIELFDK